MREKIKLNIISLVPTPHNNIIIRELVKSGKFELKLYYTTPSLASYGFDTTSFNEFSHLSRIVRRNEIRLELILKGLLKSEEKFIFIGWPNLSSQILFLLLFILRRAIFFFTDINILYEEKNYNYIKKLIRKYFIHILKNRAKKIFVVGEFAIQKFIDFGFAVDKLVNLPIFIELTKYEKSKLAYIKRKYNIRDNDILFVSGSRLIKSKGFDDLICAVSVLEFNLLQNIKLIIVGSGEEENNLKNLVKEKNLISQIIFEPWLNSEDFEKLIAISDAYIHPAKSDAFGGGTLHAMAQGVPIIGSDGAGVVVERVANLKNGLIFKAGDQYELSKCIEYFILNRNIISDMGECALKTANNWPPNRAVTILLNNLN